MSARIVAAALGKAHREGRNWRVSCPVHGGKSLALADAHDGKLLIHCFGGCESRDVWNALRERGLINGSFDTRTAEKIEEQRRREARAQKNEIRKIARRISQARALYAHALPAVGTPLVTYLRSRGLSSIPVPSVLRYVQHCRHRNGRYYPVMVAPIVNVGGEQIAIHKTFLLSDGSGKASLPKEQQRETCGPMKGGAVRLGSYRPGIALIIGEGIETTLSAMQMFGLPGWAALSAYGLEALKLPDEVREIAICADNDLNRRGQRAALIAYQRWVSEDRSVRVWLPPDTGDDFNSILRSGR